MVQNKIRGCLAGGAAGDALGYAVEFSSEQEIFSQYGPGGIGQFQLDREKGVALISDDTQMTLFTANALLFGLHRQKERGISAEPCVYALQAYLGWLITQKESYSESTRIPNDPRGWASSMLVDVPELYSPRAPGMTCLCALEARKEAYDAGERISDFIGAKINNSKGCGGVMRVAPMGMVRHKDLRRLALQGAQLAAVTHSHPLGYMPAAVLTHIINRLVYANGPVCLKQIVEEARDAAIALFADRPAVENLVERINLAIALSENRETDLDNLHLLGDGWVAEETLAIALYCALKYTDDFSKAITVSVNHEGDSDSTGAVTGNIMGALVGYEAIPQKWKQDLELHDLILEMADALYNAVSEY